MPEVSVVIPIRDCAVYLPTLFDALDGQTLSRDRFEVVLVDDRSVDETPEVVGRWVDAFPQGRRLIAGEGRGPASARNIGVLNTSAPLLAFTDSDTVPDARWLENAIAGLARTGARALEGAVTPFGENGAGPFAHRIVNERGGCYMTANMIYSRDVFDRAGGFDERFEEAFLEDSDLAFRVLDLGEPIPFDRDVRVGHPVVRRSLAGWLRNARRARWFALFAVKHPQRYETDLRPVTRPLSSVDVDVVVGLIALAALPRARGLARVAALAAAANGLKRGLASAQVHKAPAEEIPGRVAMGLLLPPAQAFWWLVGCLRYRKLAR